MIFNFFSVFIFVLSVLLHAFIKKLSVSLLPDFNWVIPFPLHLYVISPLLYYCIIVTQKVLAALDFFVLFYLINLCCKRRSKWSKTMKTKRSLPHSFFSGLVFILPESWIPCSCPHLTTTQPNSTELKSTAKNSY